MKLSDLILAVKEKNLSKDSLESYRDELSGLFAQMQLELADLEKEKAIYFEKENNPDEYRKYQLDYQKNPSDISIKRKWQATSKGFREIELKRYCLATKELLNSLKSRLYSIY